MDDSASSYPTSTSNPPNPSSNVTPTVECVDVQQQLASKASLLDIFTMAALTSRQGSTYYQARRRIDAFSQSIRTGSWKQDDASLDEDVLSLSPDEPSTPRLGSTSPQIAKSPYTYRSIDTLDKSIIATRCLERPRQDTPVTIIEPEEAGNLTLDMEMDIDEGYDGGADDDSWMTWPAIAGMKPYAGCQVSRLLQFRSAVDTAQQCSSLVYKTPRMRKRKPRPIIQQPPDPRPEQDAHLDLKRIRQV